MPDIQRPAPSSPLRPPFTHALLVTVTLLGAVLRLLRLDFQPLWWDEGYSVYFATEPLARMVALTARDIHPPLYYALLHAWLTLLGTSALTLRLFSTFIGLLTIPLIAWAGRIVGGRRVGLWAALLLAWNPLHIYYSQEVRMYALVTLFSTLALALGWRLMALTPISQGRDRARTPDPSPSLVSHLSWWGYVLAAAAALYTQYYAAFLLLGQGLYALWRRGRGGWQVLRGLALAVLLYLPWVWYATPKLTAYVAYKVSKDADRPLDPLTYLARHLAAFIAGHLEGPLAAYWPLVLLPAVLLAVVAWRTRHRLASSGAPGYLITLVAVALTLGFAFNVRFPFAPLRGERLLLFALPAWVLLMAQIFATPNPQSPIRNPKSEIRNPLPAIRHSPFAILDPLTANRYLLTALFLIPVLLSLAAFYTVPRYPDDDYRPVMERIAREGRPDDRILCIFPWQLGYARAYLPPGTPEPVLSRAEAWGPEVAEQVASLLAEGRVIWFPEHVSLGAVLETQVERYLLARAYPLVNAWYSPSTRLTAWATPPPDWQPGPGNVTFGNRVTLVESTLGPSPVPADNTPLRVALTWRPRTSLPADYHVLLRLEDARGIPYSARDSAPNAGHARFAQAQPGLPFPDRQALLIPAGTPPGEYTLRLELIPQDGSLRPDVMAPDGTSLGPDLVLARITVVSPDTSLPVHTLPIARPLRARFRAGPELLGFSRTPDPLTPGQLLALSLFWRAPAPINDDLITFIQFLDQQGRVVVNHEEPPAPTWPTSRWQAGELVHAQHRVRLPPTLPDGTYTLIVGLYRARDRARLPMASRWAREDFVRLDQVTVRGRPHTFEPPTPSRLLNATFGEKARLVGYDLEEVTSQGMTLTLYWQALDEFDRPYAVFVHLLDSSGKRVGQGDSEPGEGTLPTTGWVRGEYLRDRHRVRVAGPLPPGTYRLRVGLYDPATGARLPVLSEEATTGGDAVTLPSPVFIP